MKDIWVTATLFNNLIALDRKRDTILEKIDNGASVSELEKAGYDVWAIAMTLTDCEEEE